MNKKIVALCVFLLLFFFNNVTSAQTISQGIYNGENIKYLKSCIQAGLNKDSINDQTYFGNVINFLASVNAEIETINTKCKDESGVYVLTIIALQDDTMDALNYLSIIQNSGFFQHVSPCIVPEPTGSHF